MPQDTPANGGPTDDESVPWILRGRTAPPGGPPPAAAPAAEAPAEDVPVSKFRRVSGAPTMQAAAGPVGRGVPPPPPPPPPPARAAARATSYTPPPPPPPMEWDSEVETLRPPLSGASEPAWTPPPPSRPMAPPPPPPPYRGPGAYSPSPRKGKMSGGVIAAIVVGALVLGAGGIGGVLLLMNAGTPSRAEFVDDADAICRPANGPVAAIVKPTSYPELATAAGTLNTTIDSQLGQLRALDQPGGGAKADVAAVFTSLEGTSAAAKRLQDAAGEQDDDATIAATKDMTSQAGDARTRATTAGFAACSIGMQPGIDAVFGGSQSVIKAGFIAQADVLCRRAANDLEDIDFPASDDARSFARYIGQTIDVFDELVADIRALPVAPGEETVVDEIFVAQDKVQAKEREFQDAAADDDFDRMDALDREVITLITAADAKWDAYGLGSCGSNFGF